MDSKKTSQAVLADLKSRSNTEHKQALARFFKTGKGQYGEGDIFWGIKTPAIQEVARNYYSLPLVELEKLLGNPIHECRVLALVILKYQFKKGSFDKQKEIVNLYFSQIKYINNWDLVDISAPRIPGVWLKDKNRQILYRLAKSSDLWEKRIAIMATMAFIDSDDFEDTIKIAEILLNDKHDLIHKAVGWMLREIGKRNTDAELSFLDKYAAIMPRTMLRYAIEKFPEEKRQFYLRFKKGNNESKF